MRRRWRLREQDRRAAARRRFVWYPEDINIRHGLWHADVTPWVFQDAVVAEDEPVEPLDLGQCWRDDCYHPVPRDDDVGLCPECVAELRAL